MSKKINNEFANDLEGNVKSQNEINVSYSNIDNLADDVIDKFNEKNNVNPIQTLQAKKNLTRVLKTEIAEVVSETSDDSTDVTGSSNRSVGYLDRAEILHQMRMKMLRNQIETGSYVPDRKLFYIISMMETVTEQEREKYVTGMEENSKVDLVKEEEKMKTEELRLQAEIEKNYAMKVSKLSELTKELQKINKAILYKQKEIEASDKTIKEQEEYDKYMALKNKEYSVIISEIEEINPNELENVTLKRHSLDKLNIALLGEEHAAEVYSRSTIEFREILSNQKYNSSRMLYNAKKEVAFYRQNGISRLVEMNERHKKELLHQIKNIENIPETLEERAALQEELSKTETKVSKYKELEKFASDETNEQMIVGKTKECEKEIKEQLQEIEKDFAEIEQTVDEKEKIANTDRLENVEKTQQETNKRVNEGIATAAMVYMVTDNPKTQKMDGDVVLAVTSGVIASEHVRQKQEVSTIPGLEKQVINIENPKEAAEYIKNNEKIQQAVINQEKAEKKLSELEGNN